MFCRSRRQILNLKARNSVGTSTSARACVLPAGAMATAPVETWAFWAPFTYGLLCVLTGYIASEFIFPAIERASYRASKRLDPRSWPTVVHVVDELVAHSLLPAFGRCIFVSSFYGAVVVMNLGRDETHFGGASRVSSNRVVPHAERVARCYLRPRRFNNDERSETPLSVFSRPARR